MILQIHDNLDSSDWIYCPDCPDSPNCTNSSDFIDYPDYHDNHDSPDCHAEYCAQFYFYNKVVC